MKYLDILALTITFINTKDYYYILINKNKNKNENEVDKYNIMITSSLVILYYFMKK